MTELDKSEKIRLAGTWLCVLLLAGIMLMIFFFPNGKDYYRYESNKPVIEAFEKCMAEYNNSCTVLPLGSAYARYLNDTRVFGKIDTRNWSGWE